MRNQLLTLKESLCFNQMKMKNVNGAWQHPQTLCRKNIRLKIKKQYSKY